MLNITIKVLNHDIINSRKKNKSKNKSIILSCTKDKTIISAMNFCKYIVSNKKILFGQKTITKGAIFIELKVLSNVFFF